MSYLTKEQQEELELDLLLYGRSCIKVILDKDGNITYERVCPFEDIEEK